MGKLSSAQIKEALSSVPGWSKQGASITRVYKLKDFAGAMKFVNAVAKIAEKANHHPDLDIRWNKVTLVLSTHDQDGLTEKDFALAREFNQLG